MLNFQRIGRMCAGVRHPHNVTKPYPSANNRIPAHMRDDNKFLVESAAAIGLQRIVTLKQPRVCTNENGISGSPGIIDEEKMGGFCCDCARLLYSRYVNGVGAINASFACTWRCIVF